MILELFFSRVPPTTLLWVLLITICNYVTSTFFSGIAINPVPAKDLVTMLPFTAFPARRWKRFSFGASVERFGLGREKIEFFSDKPPAPGRWGARLFSFVFVPIAYLYPDFSKKPQLFEYAGWGKHFL